MKKYSRLIICFFAVVLFCSSCSYFGFNKLNMKRLITLYEKEGYEEVDIDDLVDEIEDYVFSYIYGRDGDLEDGVYAIASSTRVIKRIYNSLDTTPLCGLYMIILQTQT